MSEQEDFATVDFSAGMSSEELKEQLLVQIAKTENGNGVVIFTDIPGGTLLIKLFYYQLKMKALKLCLEQICHYCLKVLLSETSV